MTNFDNGVLIANYSLFNTDTMKTIFNNFLNNKLKKNAYPIKQAITIPASVKNNDQ